MTSKKITLFNPNHTPVVYTEEGHVLGGGERREVDRVDAVGQALIDSGHLADVTDPPKEDEALPQETPARVQGKAEGATKKPRSGAPDQEDHA